MNTRKSNEEISIKPLNFQTIDLDIIGVTELITHKWSDKAKQMMLDKQMGKAVEKRPKKDPQADYESSMYRLEDGTIVFPAAAFKAAIVGACRMFDGLPMTLAKQAIRVNGEFVKIDGEPRMREDMVRLETGVADIRYRAGFPEWRTRISITFNANIITPEMLINLVEAAGFGGIGEWRPSSPKSATGSFGCFRVAREGE